MLSLLLSLAVAEPSGSPERAATAAGAGDGLCAPAALANSNRDALNPCSAELSDEQRVGHWASTGTECTYACDKGYFPIGRHVCQWHDVVKTNATTGEKEWDQSDIEHTSLAAGASACAAAARRATARRACAGTAMQMTTASASLPRASQVGWRTSIT